MSKEQNLEDKTKALNIAVVIASYLPFIGVVWASDKQLKNKLWFLCYWVLSTAFGAVVFVKLALFFNWL